MQFEWDEAKRRANLIKHGIDFRDLGPIFEEVNRIELEDRRRDYVSAGWHASIRRQGQGCGDWGWRSRCRRQFSRGC